MKHIHISSALGLIAAVAVVAVLGARQQPPTPASQAPASQTPSQPQQPSEVELVISGDPGTPPRYAVPDFVAASPDVADLAKTITEVLWADLAFEREFYLIPRDTYSTVPATRSADQIPFQAWRELGADGRDGVQE